MLASLLALLSLYLFARLLLKQGNRWTRVWFVVATAAMLYTFYLMFLVVVFENSVIVVLWLRRRLPRAHLVAWLRSQIVLALAVVPTLLSVAFALTWSHGRSGYGLTWIPRPGLQALIKTAILFITGDPSYGPTGITLMRGLSLLVIMLLGVLGIAVYMRRSARGTADDEGPRILFVAAAAGFPWAAVFIVSQARPIYNEKYLLFVIPLLAILIAWIIIRARSVLLACGIMLALLGLTITALGVYYTEPDGEQWREATGYVRSAYQPGDLIIISPGFYGRPFTYYFAGSFPDNIHALDHVAAITDANGVVQAFDAAHAGGSATARRIWLVSGYAPVDSATSAWTQRSFRARDQQDFVGVHVQLLERAGP
ncbi:MAG TPA: hypothetical protein VFT66_04820, partial [Roseiflexaceae bacterium]|nr:hypothetical protein [Roseiflexaceae bacterium]